MTYELSKKLKGAGFPDSESWVEPTAETLYAGYQKTQPTLSELIEACGDVVDFSLQRRRDVWWAGSSDTDRILEHSNPSGLGATPEEAVASLWLELKKR